MTGSSGYYLATFYWKFTKAPSLFLAWPLISSSQCVFYSVHLKKKKKKPAVSIDLLLNVLVLRTFRAMVMMNIRAGEKTYSCHLPNHFGVIF